MITFKSSDVHASLASSFNCMPYPQMGGGGSVTP
jgi:hypothetical protein